MATIGSMTLNIGAESATLLRELDKSTRAVNNFARQAEAQTTLLTRGFNAAAGAARALAAAIPVLAVAAASVALTSGVRNAIEFGDALSDLSTQTGVTVKQLQELRFAATQMGSSAETLDRGVQIFARRMGEAAAGTGDLRETLASMGIAVRDAEGNVRDTGDVLLEFAAAAGDVESAAERAAIANRAFGRAGAELTGVLTLGEQGLAGYARELEDLGMVSAENADALGRAADALERWRQQISAFFVNTVGAAIRKLEDLSQALANLSGLDIAFKFPEAAAAEVAQFNSTLEETGEAGGAAAARLQAATDSMENMLESARRENEQLTALKEAHEGVGASVEFVNRAIERNNVLSAAKISKQAAEESGLTALMVANQRLNGEIKAGVAAREAQSRAAEKAVEEQKRAAADAAREQQAAADRASELMMQPFENALTNIQNAFTDTFVQILARIIHERQRASLCGRA